MNSPTKHSRFGTGSAAMMMATPELAPAVMKALWPLSTQNYREAHGAGFKRGDVCGLNSQWPTTKGQIREDRA